MNPESLKKSPKSQPQEQSPIDTGAESPETTSTFPDNLQTFSQQYTKESWDALSEEHKSTFEKLKGKINKEILEYQLKLQDGTYTSDQLAIDDEQKKHQQRITTILNQMESVRKGEDIDEILEAVESITTTYTNPEGQTETIELNLEKNLERFTNFYTEHNIDTPNNFKEIITEIWNTHAEAIKQAIEEEGFDDVLFIPPYNTEDINKKTTEQGDYVRDGEPTKTWTSNNVKDAGGLSRLHDTKPNQPRIVLIHRKNAENLQRPELAETKNKSIYELCGLQCTNGRPVDQNEKAKIDNLITNKQPLPFDGLTLAEYLIADRIHFKETGNHLDVETWSWLPGTYAGSRVARFCWDPDVSRVGVDADDLGRRISDLGARRSRTFSLNI